MARITKGSRSIHRPMDTNALDSLSILFVVVGAINWGVIGVAEVNAIELALEPIFQPAAAEVVLRGIYSLVGLAGIYLLYTAYKMGRASRRTSSPTEPERVET